MCSQHQGSITFCTNQSKVTLYYVFLLSDTSEDYLTTLHLSMCQDHGQSCSSPGSYSKHIPRKIASAIISNRTNPIVSMIQSKYNIDFMSGQKRPLKITFKCSITSDLCALKSDCLSGELGRLARIALNNDQYFRENTGIPWLIVINLDQDHLDRITQQLKLKCEGKYRIINIQSTTLLIILMLLHLLKSLHNTH